MIPFFLVVQKEECSDSYIACALTPPRCNPILTCAPFDLMVELNWIGFFLGPA